MNERDAVLSEAERAQTDANLELAVRFIQEYLDDPDYFGEIPTGSAVVLLPPDDPDLAAANQLMAECLTGEGRTVRLVTVAADRDTPSRLPVHPSTG